MRMKINTIILVIVLLLNGVIVGSGAVINSEAVSTDEMKDINDFIESYIEFKSLLYMYQEFDKVDSLSEFFVDYGENEFLNYETGRLKYLIKADEISGTTVTSYTNNFKIENIKNAKDRYYVTLRLESLVEYSYLKEPILNNIEHKLTLSKTIDGYLIEKDEYDDTFYSLYGLDADFESLIGDLQVNYEKSNNEILVTEDNTVGTRSIPGDSYDYYNSTDRSNAVTYARTYTDDTGGCSGTNYNNSQFKYFSYGNDCQNYVSQCIWYGFGGRSSANKDYPMSSLWWADATDTSSSWNWTGTSYFYDYATSNFSNNNYGIQAYSTNPSNIDIGDYVYVPGHVLFITDYDDIDNDGIIDYNEIEICAHTYNFKDRNLASLYGSVEPSNMEFMHVVKFKWNDEMSMN